ncbi:di-heme oxidoredictase family protein [uncultured Vibrio sp.]|uniref:di-heme oxidoredictase family protein n=1 Tax=uncultured Vibrio sp. TaxID=114054 RepID=UPI0025F67FBF|nr:di-heme oxidoredictase family protein [uncultured Vibrio sp.]
MTNRRFKLRSLGVLSMTLFASWASAEINTSIESGSPGKVLAEDGGWTGDWAYICVDDYCSSAALSGGFWQRDVTEKEIVSGQSYTVQLKIQDNTLSQYISPEYTLVADNDSSGGGEPPPVEGEAPTVTLSASPSSPTVGQTVQLSADTQSASSEVIQVVISISTPSGQSLPEGVFNSSSAQWTFEANEVGNYQVVVTAEDTEGLRSQQQMTVNVRQESAGGNGVVTHHIAERYRVRHELSGNDFNNFNIEYWEGRFGSFVLEDYTRSEAESLRQQACGTTEPCVVVTLNSAIPVAMTDSSGNEKSCNQQTPNWRYHKYYGDETNFAYGYVMDIVLPDGRILPACEASREQRATATTWRAIMQRWPHINRPFTAGEQIEFETTISFNRAQTTGDNVNYYGQTYRYVLGEGLTVNNRDSAVGPTGINDGFAQLGGTTTVPQLAASGGQQQRLSFMQHAYNLERDHVQSWLDGRRLIHTDFNTGAHVEEFLPGPQAINGNLPFPELAGLASDPIQPSCTQCHTLNGVGEMQPRQNVVPPKMIGMGLLENIPQNTIEQWASENGGSVSYVTVDGQQVIGRFGWRAEASSVRHQVAKALHADMGIGTNFDGFRPATLADQHLDDMETYTKLIAVPTPRENLTTMEGHRRFQEFGCDSCHKLSATTGIDAEFPELSNQVIHPYTDLLLHDLGEGPFRTAPLWGLGLSGYVHSGNSQALTLMHDGEAETIDQVMQRHNGEAASQSRAYFSASSAERQQLVDYLMAM